ncbi:glycoside hydrolase family 127 protein [Flavisolibacter sp. BT320]|nr:glycoside hydrolase family 127 protein [Flavisolibacter longurius]
MRQLFISLFLVVILPGMTQTTQGQQTGITATQAKSPLTETFQTLPTGDIKPTGWIQRQLRQNLDGFTGYLDSLVPDLILNDDIYGAARLTKRQKSKNVGAIGEEGAWQAQFLWWNSETQSNWRDGYLRTAILLNDKKHLQKAKNYVERILSTQDADGYLGIYDTELRYSFQDENGELWSKTTLLRGLLAWYEYTKDKTILIAVTRAVDNVIDQYPINRSRPFFSQKPDAGGLAHGLAFTDVLEALYRITSNRVYRDYIVFLYRDFSANKLNEDAQVQKLLNRQLALKGHGVHTYEHLRTVAAAYYATGDTTLYWALQNFLQKISDATTVSGAPIGDEFIGGRSASATTGYEYCSLHELLDSYSSMLAKTGDARFADKIENLYLNAAQGAIHPNESAICYLKTDNSFELTGGKNGNTTDKFQTRYRYSPVHKEAAVCCVPNAGRITPSYLQNAWMVQGDTLVATLFAPSIITTTVAGQPVSIREETLYPEDNTIRFAIETAGKQPFFIKIRKPAWAKKVNCSEPYTEKNNFLSVSIQSGKRQLLTIRFEAETEIAKDRNGEFYFTYGPHVLARPIEAKKTVTKTFAVAGLQESNYSPLESVIYHYKGGAVRKAARNGLFFEGELFNPVTNKNEWVELVPMGGTILRQVSFPN